MPNPIPGKTYIVQDENSLSQVAQRAYGDATLWPKIFKANQSQLRSGDPDVIFPGEQIFIPLDSGLEQLKTQVSETTLSNKAPDELTLILDGLEVPVDSCRILRTMDTVADGWTASLAWAPGLNLELDKRLLPYSYLPASVYIGGELLVNGLLYNIESEISGSGRRKNLEGFSFTADLMDSTLKPPYEKNNFTLKQRAEELVAQIGIAVIFDIDPGDPFDRITANEGDTIFNHLNKLSRQRSGLLSSTPQGDLLVHQSASGAPVATLEEGRQLVRNFKAGFNGRARFNAYRALGKSPAGNKVGIANDDNVPRSRFLTFTVNETTKGDIQKAADWRRSKQLADALTIPLPVSDWFDPAGNLWRENTLVTVISEAIHVPDGFDFLIRSVEYVLDGTARTATLNIVPPQVYTGEPLEEPWK